MSIEITDNSKEVSAAIEAAILRGLEKCGLVAEGYAKKICPVDTGNLRNSITHVVDESEPAVIIGTNNEYAAYVELGTGIYAEGVETISGTDWKVTYKAVTSSRIDTSALKKALPDVVERFSKTTTARRFCIA